MPEKMLFFFTETTNFRILNEKIVKRSCASFLHPYYDHIGNSDVNQVVVDGDVVACIAIVITIFATAAIIVMMTECSESELKLRKPKDDCQ